MPPLQPAPPRLLPVGYESALLRERPTCLALREFHVYPGNYPPREALVFSKSFLALFRSFFFLFFAIPLLFPFRKKPIIFSSIPNSADHVSLLPHSPMEKESGISIPDSDFRFYTFTTSVRTIA